MTPRDIEYHRLEAAYREWMTGDKAERIKAEFARDNVHMCMGPGDAMATYRLYEWAEKEMPNLPMPLIGKKEYWAPHPGILGELLLEAARTA